MARAIYDIVAAGVSYEQLRAPIADAELTRLALPKGFTTALDPDQAARLRAACVFESTFEGGAASRLAERMSKFGSGVVLLNHGAPPVAVEPLDDIAAERGLRGRSRKRSGSAACRFSLVTPDGQTTQAFFYGGIANSAAPRSALTIGGARLLCLEDRLWDLDGGADFVSAAIDAARNAGRTTILICGDAECDFRNHAAIRQIADSRIDFLVGDAEAVLALYGCQRLDSLVPRLRELGRGAIIRRDVHAPLIFDGAVLPFCAAADAVPKGEFWERLVPVCLAELSRSGSLEGLASPDAWRSPPLERTIVTPPQGERPVHANVERR